MSSISGMCVLHHRSRAEVTVADPCRACREPLERPRQLVALDGGQAGGSKDRAGGEDQKDVELASELLVERVDIGADFHASAVERDCGRHPCRLDVRRSFVDTRPRHPW